VGIFKLALALLSCQEGIGPDDFYGFHDAKRQANHEEVREMKSIYLSVLAAALLALSSSPTFAAGETGPKRRGKADSHMSSGGQESGDAQWSADPERGWIRVDERRDGDDSGSKTKERRGKHKRPRP
jgi:hypothetical protein